MDLEVVNAESGYSKATLIEPSSLGYIHIGANVHPRSLPFTLLPTGREKSALLNRLKELADQLERRDDVETATVFETVGMPPHRKLPYIHERADSIHLARFDVAVLVETSSPATAYDVQDASVYRTLVDALEEAATDVHVMVARNAKRVADVDKTSDGLFLFNYFVADDADVLPELFEYLAGWYAAETGLDNSTLLVPLNESDADFAAINHARWNLGLMQFLWAQLSKQSFQDYLLANLTANRAGAMPVLYQLA